MIKEENQENKRITELDGLRGMAILMVLSFHYINNQLVNNTSSIGRYLAKATSFGWVGVDLFFVLSGFFIGSILIKNNGGRKYFTTFYLRRLLRIVPNYYLLIAVSSLIIAIPYFGNNLFLTGHNTVPKWSYYGMLHNVFMAHQNTLGNDSISVVWSIGIEEQFYILLPFVIFLVNARWLPVMLGVAFFSAPLIRMQFQNWIPPYVLLPCRMDSLAAGVLIAYANIYSDLYSLSRKYYLWIMGIMTLDVLISALFYWKFNDLGIFRNSFFAIFFTGCVILAITRKESIYGAFLRNKALVWIGSLSYSLYLFHYLILGFAHQITGQHDIGIYNLKGALVSIAAFIFSLLMAWLVYLKLETPFVLAGKKLRYN